MSPNPDAFITHLRTFGYHPRSDKHSNALGEAIVSDLVAHCDMIRDKAEAGKIVYDLNFTLRASTSDWNVDLVLGPPQLGYVSRVEEGGPATRCPPSTVQIAVEIKAVMTEHRKAVKNRKRDLEAHHEHVHNYAALAIAGGVLLINASPRFKSPLRPEVSTHLEPSRLVEHCVSELRGVAARGGPRGYGLEARCAVVVNVDNINEKEARFETRPPAPQVGDPLHYDSFIRTICDLYTHRFGG